MMSDTEIKRIQLEIEYGNKQQIRDAQEKLYKVQLDISNEHMKKYHPSLDGLNAVLQHIVKYKLKQYEINDPPIGQLINGFDMFLGHYLARELVPNIEEQTEGFKVVDLELKDVINEQIKRIFMKYGFNDVKIRISSLRENRPMAGFGRRYIVSFKV